MKSVVFVTGNAKKAEYFSLMVGIDVPHIDISVDEIQSLELREIVEHKAKQAFQELNQPVIVEDTKLVFNALGSLPGPFIKFFLDELGVEGICKLLDGYNDRSAIAGAAIAYYDGVNLEIFEKECDGSISNIPKGDGGFGWNQVFIPVGENLTLGQMSEEDFRRCYMRIKLFEQIAKFLSTIDRT